MSERRRFLLHLGTGAAAILGGGARAAAQRVPRAEGPDPDRWLALLTAEYRQVYDIVTPAGYLGFAYARNFLNASNEAYGLADRDMNVVVSMRHTATPYAFGDAVWEKYGLGSVYEIDDPQTKRRATRNPVLGGDADVGSKTSSSLRALASRGVIVTVCGMAFRRLVNEAAKRTGANVDAVRGEWEAALFPGAFVAPAGVVAVNRAQKHGCAYVYAG
jgi:intracellular sulfur oxidation DsrE/DsrF family protein